MKNKMKKDYRLGFKYGLNPLSNALFLVLGYSNIFPSVINSK